MKNKKYVALFISIVSVSFAAIFIRSCVSEPLSIAFYRLLFTTLLVFPFVIFNSRTRNELTSLSYSKLIIMTGIGLILAAHFSLWITSLQKTSIASSVILVTAHPLLVGPISHYFFKEKLLRTNVIGIILSIAGVIVLVIGNYRLETMTLEGNILAILGGVAAGFYILGGRKIRKSVSVVTYAFVVYSVCTLALLATCFLFGAPLYNLNPRDYQIIFLMAIVSGIFGHTLYNWSLRHIPASVASVALLGEPLGSTVLAFALPWIHEIPSYYTILGGGIILLGIYLTAREMREQQDSS